MAVGHGVGLTVGEGGTADNKAAVAGWSEGLAADDERRKGVVRGEGSWDRVGLATDDDVAVLDGCDLSACQCQTLTV